MYTLRQYLSTVDDSRGLTRTLGELDPLRDAAGRPLYTAGNSAIVFRIRHAGHICALRCYRRPMRRLREIYGNRLLEKELYLFTSTNTGAWVDVVLTDWVEGITLREAIAEATQSADTARLSALASAFDHLAAELLADDWAHGDLKPENLIVDADGALHLIDFDAQYLPAFAGETSPELGTAAYQHPTRTAATFSDALDDFPIALISTALHALTQKPALWTQYAQADGLLFTPCRITTDHTLNEILTLFEREGLALRYRIAGLLRSPTYRLFGLEALLTPPAAASTEQTPELFEACGRWGYRTPDQVVIAPVYDCGFEFSEGLAAVQLHRTWHFIDTAGAVLLHCPEYEAVKPFREGRATAIRQGVKIAIDRHGNEFDI